MNSRKNSGDYFGSLVFNESTMRDYIPETSLGVWKECVRKHSVLPEKIAADIADGMKRWALEQGATHYTHWFQPLTGETAEKHEGFLIPSGQDGFRMEFSSKELIKGEPDASSFPSGGLRSTFEARGYSAWDPTSYAFIKDKVLCIPTVFCSYSGEVLDKKTPLLRSGEALNRQAIRVLRLLGDDKTGSVTTNVGAEQEYFLLRKEQFMKREDLRLCGRTLFGADAPKKQELDDHYYGAIKPEVTAFMQDLNDELWKLGICAKTEHNEVAPAQYEMAPFFTNANLANDQNQLTMEIMKRVAEKHDLVCLLSEKPFAGINGSGKHVNWSVSTDTGENLFSPGRTPAENTRFLLFLAAFVSDRISGPGPGRRMVWRGGRFGVCGFREWIRHPVHHFLRVTDGGEAGGVHCDAADLSSSVHGAVSESLYHVCRAGRVWRSGFRAPALLVWRFCVCRTLDLVDQAPGKREPELRKILASTCGVSGDCGKYAG